MKTKICSNKNCKHPEKPLSEFGKNKSNPDKTHYWCKVCVQEYNYKNKEKRARQQKEKYEENKEQRLQKAKDQHQKFPWKRVFGHIKDRCENPNNDHYKYYGNRGIKNKLTEEELKFLWFRDKAWLLNQPSIDREDNDGNYTLDNCRFIELGKNVAERNKRVSSKVVLQLDKHGDFIKEWSSTRDIERELGLIVSRKKTPYKHVKIVREAK